jgi:threonine/homoserine/homoserine lactone efflux protein
VSAALVAGLVAGLGIAMPVGSVAAYLVLLGSRSDRRTGVAAALGVASVDGGYAAVAALGGATLGPLLQPVLEPARWVSAAVLVALAVRTAVSASRPASPVESVVTGPARAYATLVALTAVNPTTVIYFAALVTGSPVTGSGAVFAAAAFAGSAAWQLVVVVAGRLLGSVVAGDRGRRGTAAAAAVVMLALAVRTVL